VPAKVRDAVAPAWLIEAVRPRPAPAPVGLMVRAALAICAPLAVGFAAHQPALGLLPAMGGLLASVVDIGGPYPARARRVVSATVAGGAAGLVLGGLIHGRGWVTIAVLIAVAGVSVLFSAAGGTASVTGLQLLVYTSFGAGPLAGEQVSRAGLPRPGGRERLRQAADQLRGGRLIWLSAVRLMACVGVAALMSEVLPLQRSYWVTLTVAIVLKPDLGSVFARAVQRGLGTIVGVLLGAVILAVVPYGWPLLVPAAVLAALIPYGRSRNYGLMSTFLTPLIVLLLDLPAQAGWQLAGARLADTLLGCAIVLVIGYAPWPMSWYAHLPAQFASTVGDVCAYMEQALVERSPSRHRLRRRAYRALSDLRAEFQRTMSEPPAVSRRATTWWPAVVGLEEVVDAVTAAAVGADHGVTPPAPEQVRELIARLEGVADAERSGTRPPEPASPAPGEHLSPVAEAVRRVQAALA
jgi:uncharacterized membrane protein YccC